LEKRLGWELREKDPIYETVDPSALPLEVPLNDIYKLWDVLYPSIDNGTKITDSKAVFCCKNMIQLLESC
jgi:hypothetical protein